MLKKGFILLSIMVLVVGLSITGFAKTTIEFQTLDGGPEYQDAYNKIIEMFEEENPDIEVEPVYTSWGNGHEKLLVRFAASNPPEIAQFNDDYIGDYAHKDILHSLNDLFEDQSQFYQPPIELATIDGELRSWAIAYKPRVIYYNVDWFEEAGVEPPPDHWNAEGWDWDAFLEKAKKLTEYAEENRDSDAWGVSITYGQEPWWWIRNNAPEGYKSIMDKEAQFDQPWLHEAVEFCKDLHWEHDVQPSWATDEDVGQRELFLSEKVAMIVNGGSWELPFFREADFDWDIAPYPKKERATTEASLVNFGVMKTSSNPEAAKKFLRFLMEPESQDILAEECGLMPARREVAETLEWTEPYPGENNHLFLEAMENAAFGPWETPGWYQVRNIVAPAFEEIYTSPDKSAEEVLTKLNPEAQAVLDNIFN